LASVSFGDHRQSAFHSFDSAANEGRDRFGKELVDGADDNMLVPKPGPTGREAASAKASSTTFQVLFFRGRLKAEKASGGWHGESFFRAICLGGQSVFEPGVCQRAINEILLCLFDT